MLKKFKTSQSKVILEILSFFQTRIININPFSFKLAEKDVFLNVPTIRNDKEFQTAFEITLTNESLHKSHSK